MGNVGSLSVSFIAGMSKDQECVLFLKSGGKKKTGFLRLSVGVEFFMVLAGESRKA